VANNKFYYSLSFLWLIISLLFYTGPYIYSICSAFSIYKPDCFIVILQFVIEQKPYIFFYPFHLSFSVSPKLMDTRFCKTRAQHISWGQVHSYPHSPMFSGAATLRHAPSYSVTPRHTRHTPATPSLRTSLYLRLSPYPRVFNRRPRQLWLLRHQPMISFFVLFS
jgi:hypothetical protein